MDTLETLAVALGFATLAGLNLYLVVLVAGAAINMGWVDVSSTYPELMVLGEPGILIAAGVLFCLEFFSDKVPWVDSLWDSVHTVIRPVGGALLAIQTLGPTEPVFDVIIGLLAGGTTLVAHSFKAGTRLAVNASPEPMSNIVASVTEDVAVLGGLALMLANPLLAGAVLLLFLGVSLYLGPKFFRHMKAFAWLVGKKALSPLRQDRGEELLYAGLRADEDLALSARLGGRAPEVEWSVPVLVGRSKRFRAFAPNVFGRLVSEAGSGEELHFLGRKFFRPCHATLSIGDLAVTQESRFLSEDVVIYDRSGRRKLVLRLPAGERALANRVVEQLLQTGGGNRENKEAEQTSAPARIEEAEEVVSEAT